MALDLRRTFHLLAARFTGRTALEDGSLAWVRDGLLHRDTGPAVEHPDGRTEFWKNGKQLDAAGAPLPYDPDADERAAMQADLAVETAEAPPASRPLKPPAFKP